MNAEIINIFVEQVYVYGNENSWDRITNTINIIFNFIVPYIFQVT
ncbi:hypothetical protein [Veillonella montpellierensis]